MKEIEVILESLKSATSYLDVFGACNEADAQKHVKTVYRRLVRKTHPDRFKNSGSKEKASEAFKLLQSFFEEAIKAAEKGRYGETPSVIIMTRKNEFLVSNIIASGDICDLYEATTKTGADLILKIPRSPSDNDLMEAEARALKKIRGKDSEPELFKFFPELIESFTYRDDSINRRVNVINRLNGWVNLEEVRKAYPNGVSPVHMIWIWRKVLAALDCAHNQGVLNGSPLPPHIMVLPKEHGVNLVDWCYSADLGSGDEFTAIKAICPRYQDWYPNEVITKEAPSYGTDIYLAALSMVYILGGDSKGNLPHSVPKAFRAFLKGCLQEKHRLRPQDAGKLLAEFDELLEWLGPPYWPRRFHEFVMPS